MTSRPFRSTVRTGLALLALTLLAGCVGAPRWGNWSKHPSPAELAATRPAPAQKVQYRPGVYGMPQR